MIKSYKKKFKYLIFLCLILKTLIFTVYKLNELKTSNGSYVTLGESMLRGDHRAGNHLFMLAALLRFSHLTGRKIIMPVNNNTWYLDKLFDFQRYSQSRYNDGIIRWVLRSALNFASDGEVVREQSQENSMVNSIKSRGKVKSKKKSRLLLSLERRISLCILSKEVSVL
ncbi:hypothetical protein HELRODRAFT_158794 [Helobdella robusta]|uniref:Uncharacterized protein n=1 Tax=Helobdella robusta TaxID=6412 RepID=T1EN98_HELRO|nr:hypothetical protein HELRODRAFT_158794 [Helobdella robusta]ESO12307.1 hypothetical protein HELRODRAFT_158794 [Helobdella robusta]